MISVHARFRYSGARSLRAQFVRGHEVIETVESYLEYRFRPTEGMSL